MSAHAAPASRRGAGPSLSTTAARVASQWGLAVTIAAALCAICFGATDGNELTAGTGLVPNTAVQMALTIAGGALLAAALAVQSAGRLRLWGLGCAILLLALAAFTASSVVWSVDPANSWLEANRTFAYASSFIGAIALARIAATRWRSVLAGVLLATLAVSVYALLAKILPSSLDAGDAYARLQQPFGDWNAVGLTAALGVVPCLWLGARREGHGVLNALAAPALCALLVTVLLSFSRGALAAAVIGAALWFVLVPLRLRAIATVAIAGVAAGAVIAWAYRQPALIDDHAALPARNAAGHRLGAVLVVALVLSLAGALLTRFATDRHAPSPRARRRVGIAVIVCLALVPVAGVAALAHSQRGLSGSISHAWNSLTNPAATQASTNPGRLTTISNNHSLYWKYALEVFDSSPVLGAGAGSFPIADQRFMTGPDFALQAHSYIFQTLADLGLAGLAISLAFALAWVSAAVRAVGPLRPRAPGAGAAERVGLVTMVAVVAVFVVDSTIDRTWFVPGDTVIALLCAGWIAGRGPHTESRAGRLSLARLARSPAMAGCALAAIAVSLVIAWTQWQPLRSEQAATAGFIALANYSPFSTKTAQNARLLAAARADELAAVTRDPLDITPLEVLGQTYVELGESRLAKATVEHEVELQPSNAQSWIDLATYYQGLSGRTASNAATSALATALYLGPWIPTVKQLYLESLKS